MHASGVDGVRSLTKPSTAVLPSFGTAVAEIRAALPVGSLTRVELREFEVERATNKPPTTRLRYTVGDSSTAVDVELWIEGPVEGQRYVESVRLARLGS